MSKLSVIHVIVLQLYRAKPGKPANIILGVCVCVSFQVCVHVAACGPIGTKFGTHMQIHLERVVSVPQN